MCIALSMLLLGQTSTLAESLFNRVHILGHVRPNTVTGQLDKTSNTLDNGRYFNSYPLEGTAGESIRIELVSRDFDTYLILMGPDGNRIAENDDADDGSTNSQLVLSLPSNGTYQILVNSYSIGAAGRYTLSWQPTTATEVAKAEAFQRAVNLNQQANELSEQGRYSEAELLYLQALEIDREVFGERHPSVAKDLNNLAVLYRIQGRYSEAESFHLQALEIDREALGEHHPSVATDLNNLAVLYVSQGRYSEAEPLHLESLAIVREQLGERHIYVASSLNNLAELYRIQDRYSEAEPLYLESLAIVREQLGEHHLYVASSLNNLGLPLFGYAPAVYPNLVYLQQTLSHLYLKRDTILLTLLLFLCS